VGGRGWRGEGSGVLTAQLSPSREVHLMMEQGLRSSWPGYFSLGREKILLGFNRVGNLAVHSVASSSHVSPLPRQARRLSVVPLSPDAAFSGRCPVFVLCTGCLGPPPSCLEVPSRALGELLLGFAGRGWTGVALPGSPLSCGVGMAGAAICASTQPSLPSSRILAFPTVNHLSVAIRNI
jgi:hypothetical protein